MRHCYNHYLNTLNNTLQACFTTFMRQIIPSYQPKSKGWFQTLLSSLCKIYKTLSSISSSHHFVNFLTDWTEPGEARTSISMSTSVVNLTLTLLVGIISRRQTIAGEGGSWDFCQIWIILARLSRNSRQLVLTTNKAKRSC